MDRECVLLILLIFIAAIVGFAFFMFSTAFWREEKKPCDKKHKQEP